MAGFTTWLYDSTLAKVFRWAGDSVSGSGNVVDQTDAAWHSPRGPLETTDGDDEYETVAASQTAQVLGATGGAGDYIKGILVVPATTSPGAITLLDNATSITVFAGGATSVVDLKPFYIPLGHTSVSGAWKLTTGANVSALVGGDFT